jgi:hypothetical protein
METDPDNTLFWRRTPVRLEAEVVRDSILSLAGELDCAQGGPPIPPAAQADSKRRSLYFQHSNNERNLFLSTFDAATVKECYRREQSIVPQQALALSNSRLVHDAAPKIAARLGRDCAPGDEAFAIAAWSAVLGVQANAQEVAACSVAMQSWREDAVTSRIQSVAETLARSRLVWTLLNHNDFVTLR